MLKYIVFNVKAITEEGSDVTKFRTLGIPYGGPDYLGKKDLDGEAFNKNTDFGRKSDGSLRAPEVFAYYDHALGKYKDLIGSAKFVQDTDDGLVWDIEVEKAHRYHDMLVEMANNGFLGVSSQPVQTSALVDKSTGEIKRWHTAELSLTPRPSNPDAVVQMLKSYNMDEDYIAFYKEFVEEVEAEEVEAEEVEAEENEQTPPEDATDTGEGNDLSSEIENAFNEEDEDAEGETPSTRLGLTEELQTFFNALSAQVNAINTRVDAIAEQQVANQEEVKAVVSEVMTSVQDVRKGVKTFAMKVAEELKFKVQEAAEEEEQLSDAERDAREISRNKRFSMPDYAPGKKGK